MEPVQIRGYLWLAAVIGVMWFVRAGHLRDDEGKPTGNPPSLSWECLATAMFFFVELLLKLDRTGAAVLAQGDFDRGAARRMADR